jgi:hypothetical protein
MASDKHNHDQSFFDKQIDVILRLPWPEVLGDVWKIICRAIRSWTDNGMYKVLEYESTLELKDRGGKRTTPLWKPPVLVYLKFPPSGGFVQVASRPHYLSKLVTAQPNGTAQG